MSIRFERENFFINFKHNKIGCLGTLDPPIPSTFNEKHYIHICNDWLHHHNSRLLFRIDFLGDFAYRIGRNALKINYLSNPSVIFTENVDEIENNSCDSGVWHISRISIQRKYRLGLSCSYNVHMIFIC